MKKNPYPGLFIVLEGLDGSGTSTQAELLFKYLKEKNYKMFLTREPSSSLIGGLIRGQLTHDWKSSPECLQLLFAADRAHHLEKEIIPALKERRIVISDRYFFSTIAYGSLEIEKKWLLSLNERFILPDLTILIKLSPRECLRRIKEGRFQLELFEEEPKLKKVWETYLWLSKKFPNVSIIDGNKEEKWVFQEVIGLVNSLLSTP